MKLHPLEEFAPVEYTPPERPKHIVEVRHVPVDGFRFKQPRTFVAADEISTVDHLYGWRDIVKWEDLTKAWRMRELVGHDKYDMMEIARIRRRKLFGDPNGVATNITAMFEDFLMSKGYRPVILDNLCAQSPGRVLAGRNLYHTHIYYNGEREVSMQFGLNHFNFVFMLSDAQGVFQVPVEAEKFDDALAGKLPNLLDLLAEQQRPVS